MLRLAVLVMMGVVSTCTPLGGQQAEEQSGQRSVSPPLPGDQTARTMQALRSNDTEEALKEYRSMVEADPKNSQAWAGLGILLYGSGRAVEASDALTKALLLDPKAPRAELFLALSQADLQQCASALPILQRYFDSEERGKLQRLTGLTLMQCSNSSKDVGTIFRVAAQLKERYPGDADVLYTLAEFYTRMWTETADELITTHPESYRVHLLAAEVSEAQGNLGQAVRQYRAALGANPKLPQMHYRIGQLLLKSGGDDADVKAMEEFRAELAINPQSATSALAMAEIERHEGKLTEAAEQYKAAARLEPDLIEARVGLAQTLLAQHEVVAAETQLHTLIAEHPENAQAHYALMLAYREQGKLPEATMEMDAFRRLQQGSADQFQKKLNALLSGTTDATGSTFGPSSVQ